MIDDEFDMSENVNYLYRLKIMKNRCGVFVCRILE